MKKNICKSAIVVVMLSGMLFFTSCAKEKSNETENTTDITTSTETTTQNTTTQHTTTQDTTTEETTLRGKVAISKDPEVAEAMREVLKGKRDFISVDEGNEWTNIHTFDCFDGKSGYNLENRGFAAMDIEEDGNYEIVLYFLKGKWKQIYRLCIRTIKIL